MSYSGRPAKKWPVLLAAFKAHPGRWWTTDDLQAVTDSTSNGIYHLIENLRRKRHRIICKHKPMEKGRFKYVCEGEAPGEDYVLERTRTDRMRDELPKHSDGIQRRQLALLIECDYKHLSKLLDDLMARGEICCVVAKKSGSAKTWCMPQYRERIEARVHAAVPHHRQKALTIIAKDPHRIRSAGFKGPTICNVEPTILPGCPADRWNVTLPPGGGQITQDWRLMRAGVKA